MFASLLLSAVASVAAVPVSASVLVEVAVALPQDGGIPKPATPPGGGTPEPTTMLLLAGGAIGYGALRLARRRGQGDDVAK